MCTPARNRSNSGALEGESPIRLLFADRIRQIRVYSARAQRPVDSIDRLERFRPRTGHVYLPTENLKVSEDRRHLASSLPDVDFASGVSEPTFRSTGLPRDRLLLTCGVCVSAVDASVASRSWRRPV